MKNKLILECNFSFEFFNFNVKILEYVFKDKKYLH